VLESVHKAFHAVLQPLKGVSLSCHVCKACRKVYIFLKKKYVDKSYGDMRVIHEKYE
jgi:hypothetical protein